MEDLANAIHEGQVILFVGASVSRKLGLPSFRELIDHLAKDIGYDPDIYGLFGDDLALAEYYRIQKGTIGPLRSRLDREWHAKVDIGTSRIHELIIQLKCRIIYTTNYDRWLENAHEYYHIPYQKVVSVGDIPNLKENRVQIVKFHGDFDDDESIVLTETSYFERLSFESPLDIKLRADALGRTILFIGYSLADINIRYLLYKIHIQWEKSGFAKIRPKSYIFFPRPNPVQEKILKERGITAFVSDTDDPAQGMEDFLEQLVKKAFSKT